MFQTSSHRTTSKEKPLAEIPADVTHVYVRQHKTTGLQSPFEGPFLVVERPSRSTVKIEVGTLKNGEKRYEVRHFNDLKLAHEDSPAAPIHRSKLGRPAKAKTENKSQIELPHPPPDSTGRVAVNNQTRGKIQNEETQPPPVSSANDEFQGVVTGPPPVQPFGRPVRSTRNPYPMYVDSFWLASAIRAPGHG